MSKATKSLKAAPVFQVILDGENIGDVPNLGAEFHDSGNGDYYCDPVAMKKIDSDEPYYFAIGKREDVVRLVLDVGNINDSGYGIVSDVRALMVKSCTL